MIKIKKKKFWLKGEIENKNQFNKKTKKKNNKKNEEKK